MGQIYNLHNAVNNTHAYGHGSIYTCQKQRFQQQVKKLSGIHEGPKNYLFGIGATACPVAASFGKTMSTLLSGLFCVITKGYTAWPSAPNLSTWPGRMESFNCAFFSALRMASLSREPAASMAWATMRIPSYAGAAYQESTS